jgi:CubicO group peptidase (beta-lactamase class C family)
MPFTRRAMIFSGISLALRKQKVDEAAKLIQSKIDSGEVRAASLHVRGGKDVFAQDFGAAKAGRAVFLIASITKPMTATAVMLLADRGALSVSDPVRKYIPEFQGGEKDKITIRHLLTHSTGLPDMLPENESLRKRHAPLKDFVAGTCATPLLFSPGTRVRYQSMGILLAAEIVERVARKPLPEFLRAEVFGLLGMKDTSLGMGGRKIADTMQSQVEEVTDWDWNSAYWRNLGSPWGGAHATAADVATFLAYFAKPGVKLLKPETAASMIVDQTGGLTPSWGYGWALARGFGKQSSPRVFGHSGSTGTLAWLDPEKDLSFVLLTTKPAAASNRSLITPASDLISEAS